MAESQENGEEAIACQICTGLSGDKSTSETDEASSSSEGEDIHEVIQCSVCLAPTSLLREPVACWPVNFQLLEDVEQFAADFEVEDDIPYCSVCEGNNKPMAVKFCTSCCFLYCEDCLESYHPMKGGFKRHRLISAQEHMSQETSVSQIQTDPQIDPELTCGEHGQQLFIYCVTCEVVLCVGCLGEHPLHSVRDINSACEEDKARIKTKNGLLENVVTQLERAKSELKDLQNNIEENQTLHLEDIEKAYCAGLDVLKTWRNDSTEAVRSRHTEWSGQSAAAVKHLEMELEEVGMAQKSSQDLLASDNVQILKGSKELFRRIDEQLAQINTSMKEPEDIKQTLLKSVRAYPVVPRYLILRQESREQRIMRHLNFTKPGLIFTETSDERLGIFYNGSVTESANLSSVSPCRAVTNGGFQTGRYYWELQITLFPNVRGSVCYCRVGVLHKGCGVRGDPDPGDNTWCLRMECRHGIVRCYSHCGGEIQTVYEKWRPQTPSLHLGVVVDCDNRSMTVLDADNNRRIFRVNGLSVSEPLVPCVTFYQVEFASARLITGDSVILHPMLGEIFLS